MALVVQTRGVQFRKDGGEQRWRPLDDYDTLLKLMTTEEDVAAALRFRALDEYLFTLKDNPDDIHARIQALVASI